MPEADARAAPNSFKTGQGVLAEYTLVEPHLLAKKPAGLSHAEAASFPLAGLTAWQALFKQGQLKAGQRVFVVSQASTAPHSR